MDIKFLKEMIDTPSVSGNEFELQKKDFPHSLIVGYRLDNLKSAQKELNEKTSVASLKGCASRIAKDRKRYVGSAKINDVRNDKFNIFYQIN